jgi:hypothetical protein
MQTDLIEQKLVASALETISTKGIVKYTPKEAFKEGLNVRKALRVQPQQTKQILCALVMDLCQFVDAKRTLTTDEDIIYTVEAIIEGYPILTIEEFRLICDKMKRGQYGKFYERLKLAEIEEAIKHYEGNQRAKVLEDMHTYKSIERGLKEGQKVNYQPQSMADLKRKRYKEIFGKDE